MPEKVIHCVMGYNVHVQIYNSCVCYEKKLVRSVMRQSDEISCLEQYCWVFYRMNFSHFVSYFLDKSLQYLHHDKFNKNENIQLYHVAFNLNS